jgi:nucleotide-binding universal stress UspA family protein
MVKILLCVDGSEAALNAVRHALSLFEQGLHASYVLVNVQEPASLYEIVVAPDVQALEHDAAENLLAPAEQLLKVAGASYEIDAAVGDAAHALLDLAHANDCDAIVMGAGGMSGERRGSVATALLHHSNLPVTVVPLPESIGEDIDDDDAED